MKSRFLFPYWCRYLGYVCIVAHIPVLLTHKMLDSPNPADGPELFNAHHLFFMATTLLMLIGLLLVAFSKEKIEDEQIAQLRLDSLQWAIYMNYAILVVSLIFTHNQDVWDIVYLNLWVPLIFFIIRFRWVIFRLNRSLKEDARLS